MTQSARWRRTLHSRRRRTPIGPASYLNRLRATALGSHGCYWFSVPRWS